LAALLLREGRERIESRTGLSDPQVDRLVEVAQQAVREGRSAIGTLAGGWFGRGTVACGRGDDGGGGGEVAGDGPCGAEVVRERAAAGSAAGSGVAGRRRRGGAGRGGGVVTVDPRVAVTAAQYGMDLDQMPAWATASEEGFLAFLRSRSAAGGSTWLSASAADPDVGAELYPPSAVPTIEGMEAVAWGVATYRFPERRLPAYRQAMAADPEGTTRLIASLASVPPPGAEPFVAAAATGPGRVLQPAQAYQLTVGGDLWDEWMTRHPDLRSRTPVYPFAEGSVPTATASGFPITAELAALYWPARIAACSTREYATAYSIVQNYSDETGPGRALEDFWASKRVPEVEDYVQRCRERATERVPVESQPLTPEQWTGLFGAPPGPDDTAA
jgi:hypothetical protein